MLSALLPDIASRARDEAAVGDGWIPGARVLHLASKWQGRGTFLLLDDRVPRLVVKADWTPRGRRRLHREYEALQWVNDVAGMPGTVPRPVALFDHDGVQVLVQTALDGSPLAVALRRRVRVTAARVRADHALVLDWLGVFQGTHAGSRTVTPERVVHLAEEVLPGDKRWAKETISHVAELASELGAIELPLAPAHGDLGPSNVVLRPDGGIGIVDWEGARPQAPAINDIFLFLHHYARSALMPTRRRGRLERHDVAAAAFLGDGVVAQETRRSWEAALARLSLPGEAASYLLFAVLVMFARNATEYAHQDRVGLMWTRTTRRYAREWARRGFAADAVSA